MEYLLFIIVLASISFNAFISVRYMNLFNRFSILLKSKDSIEYEDLLSAGKKKEEVLDTDDEIEGVLDIFSLNPSEFIKIIKGTEKK